MKKQMVRTFDNTDVSCTQRLLSNKPCIMKLIFIPIVLICSLGKAQIHKVPVQLIDYSNDKTPAYCGYQIAYGLLKVKIDNDILGFKAGDTILIFQTCPREIMEQEVKQYINGNKYELKIGNEISKSDLEKARKVLKLNYPKEHLQKIYYGKLSTLN